MQKILRGILVFSAFAGAVTLSAQTADEIVARHVAAVGGTDVISRVKSLSMEITTQVNGAEMTGTVVTLDGVASRSESAFNGAKIVQCYTDKGGWFINPLAGVSDPTPMPEDQYKLGKSQIFVDGDLHDYAANGTKLELVSKDAGGYTVKVTTKDNVESTYVFDASTYLIKTLSRKGRIQDQDVDITTSPSDYRKTDVGLMVPYAINVDLGGQYSMNITVNKVEINKTVDPAICEMPKAAQPPTGLTATPN
jgi:hypothetical protein